MSIQAQGADGAGTKTAESAYLDAIQGIINHSVHFDPATGRYCGVLAAAKEIVRLTPPAPATPPGVPDSVRDLSEGRVERVTRALLDHRGFHYADDPMEFGQNAYDITNETRGEAIAVLNALGEQRINPAHPAGQSAGSGAETMRAKAAEVARNSAAVCGEGELYVAHKIADEIEALPLSAPDSTRTGSVREVDIAELAALEAGANGGDWTVRQQFANQWRLETQPNGPEYIPLSLGLICTTILEVGVTEAQTAENAKFIAAAVCYVRKHVLGTPAPDSTRTGDEGTEREAIAREIFTAWFLAQTAIHDGIDGEAVTAWEAGTDYPDEFDLAYAAADRIIAARPAAPEAQVETEEVEKLAWIILANLRTDVSVTDLRRKLDEEQSGKFGLGRSWCQALDTARRQARAIFAARPAAPEAQGAWSSDMEAAPRDGSDVEIVNGRGQFIAQFDATWADGGWWMVSDGKDPERPLRGNEPFAWRLPTVPPSDPAPSGQAEG